MVDRSGGLDGGTSEWRKNGISEDSGGCGEEVVEWSRGSINGGWKWSGG